MSWLRLQPIRRLALRIFTPGNHHTHQEALRSASRDHSTSHRRLFPTPIFRKRVDVNKLVIQMPFLGKSRNTATESMARRESPTPEAGFPMCSACVHCGGHQSARLVESSVESGNGLFGRGGAKFSPKPQQAQTQYFSEDRGSFDRFWLCAPPCFGCQHITSLMARGTVVQNSTILKQVITFSS